MKTNMTNLLARITRFLAQEIDMGGVVAGLRANLTGLVRRVVLAPLPEPGSVLPPVYQDRSSVVLMAVPVAAIHSFELTLAPVAGISDAKLIENNFEAHAPFRRDAVFWAFQRMNTVLQVRYVPKKSIESHLLAWRAAGQGVDGLALDTPESFVVLFDRKNLVLRLLRAHSAVLLGLSAVVLALCVMSQVLERQHKTQEVLKDRLMQLLAERRSMDRPGNARLDAALRAEVLNEADYILACLRANMPADAAVSALAVRSEGVRLRFASPEPGETLSAACRRVVERQADGVWLLRRQERTP